jgi:cold shock CspA family protein
MIRAVLIAWMLLATLRVTWSQTASTPGSSSFTAPATPLAKSDSSLKPQTQVPLNPVSDRLFDLPPLKQSPASLIGGALESIDRVRDRLVLRLFGQGRITVAFDPRTQFLRGDQKVRAQDMRPGDRVYVETVLDGTAVFAKTVHLPADTAQGAVTGQVVSYDATRGIVSVRDELSSQPARFRLTSTTAITGAGIGPGALVQLSFLPGEPPPIAREIRVLIAPGAVFTFSGRVTFLDLSAQEVVLLSATDNTRYEIQLNPAALQEDSLAHLREGANVTIAARFDGRGYVAESVTLLSSSAK